MATYLIKGGKPLKGTITPIPNKNAVLKIIPAALLTDEVVTLHNVPKSSDVRIMLRIIKSLGGKVSYLNKGKSVRINAKSVNSYEIDQDLSQKAKASVMFIAPLLLRFGKVSMPIPGGCKLGSRPLDAFIGNMKDLGVTYKRKQGYYLEAAKLKGTKIWSWFPSVTATENFVILATMTPGTTEIYNAACEPHTQDLCNMLVSMGANISGIGTNKLVIKGVDNLHGTEWNVIPDHLDIGGYIAAGAVTGGELLIKNAIPSHLGMMLQVFEKVGIRVDIRGEDIFVPAKQSLVCAKTVRDDVFEIFSLPWPGLPLDFIQVMMICALKAKGSMILHNSFQEYGMFWINELVKLKAKVIMADPHRVITFGPTDFKPTHIFAPNIIQATFALFLAALSAKGESIFEDSSDSLDRRYPDIEEKYSKIGANIKRIK